MLTVRELAAIACTLAVSTILLAPPPASAAHDPVPAPGTAPASAPISVERPAWSNGVYFEFDGNLGDALNPSTDADFGVDLDWLAGVGFGLGYRLGPVRFEGEFSPTYFRVGSLDLGGASPFAKADYAGGMWANSLMANVYVEFPAAGKIRPYLGAGYGQSWVTAEYNESICFIYCFSTDNEIVNDWTRVNAWQFMAGASFLFDQSASEWFIGYRYFATDELEFRAKGGPTFIQDRLESHSLHIGFRFYM